MKKSEQQIRDILDIGRLQALQHAFSALTKVTMAIIGPDGQVMTETSSLYGYAQLVWSHPWGQSESLAVQDSLLEQSRADGAVAIHSCPYSGLQVAAAPIMLGSQRIASWMIGPLRLGGTVPPNMAGLAAQLGQPEQALWAAYNKLPAFGRRRFEAILRFLDELGAFIVHIGDARQQVFARNKALTRLTRQLEDTSKTLRNFVNATEVAMYVADYHTGDLLMVNQAFASFYGRDVATVEGDKCWKYSGKPDQDGFCTDCPREQLLDADGRPAGPITWEYAVPQRQRWVRCTNQAIYWIDGRLAHMVTVVDITDEHRMREELTRLAYTDQQLGLPNSLRLQNDLEADSAGEGRFLVCFDITSLRRVNDAYGREAGDALLNAVVDWLDSQKFGHHRLYRVDGDEFWLYFKGGGTPAGRVGRAVAARFEQPWSVLVNDSCITLLSGVSVAVVSLPAGLSNSEVMNAVQRTLDAARAGNGVAEYSRETDEAQQRHVRLQLSLKNCVRDNMKGFDVYFQPIVDPVQGRWRALETLCRWTDPETGPVPPPVFIGEAEQLGLICAVGLWVLERALGHCKQWRLDELEGFFVTVNLSPDQLTDAGLAKKVTNLLKKYNFPGEKLVLEITESSEMTFTGMAAKTIETLRFRGVRFALDDFGTGYSSFNNLKTLPVSLVKTERAFIQDIENDRYMQYFIYALAQLSHAADMRLVAEGIETRQQLDIVVKNGADLIQGYYFSRPLPPAQLQASLQAFRQVDPALLAADGPAEDEPFASDASYFVTPQLFQLLVQCVQVFAEQPDNVALKQVLSLVAGYLQADRARFLKVEPEGSFSIIHEWTSGSGAPPRTGQQADQAVPGWLSLMTDNGFLMVSDITRLPVDVQDELLGQNVRAFAVLPMNADDGSRMGYLRFDCAAPREWPPEEAALLHSLALMLGNVMKRRSLQQQLQAGDARFTDVMDVLNLGVVAIDTETDEILWANRHLCEILNDDHLVGKKCHEGLHGNRESCSFCASGGLRSPGAEGQKPVEWELYHQELDRYYLVHSSLVRWSENKKVCLEYALDTTEVKRAQLQLQYNAGLDKQTGALNSPSLLGALRAALQEASARGQRVTVVMFGVHGMRDATKAMGKSGAGALLQQMLQSVRAQMRTTDIVGRYHGDTFVAVLPGCSTDRVWTMMEAAGKALASVNADAGDAPFTLGFGVADSGEVRPGTPDTAAVDLVRLAGKRLRAVRGKRE